MALGVLYYAYDGNAWVEYKFYAYDADKLGGQLPGFYAPISGPSFTGPVKLTNDATDTFAHRFALYDSNNVCYGMMLWNTNGTSGEYSTMIYGPNQASRRISFGKVNSAGAPTQHSHITELAYVDLDDGSINTIHQYKSTLANGTAPLVVASATLVTNLNADKLDGQDGSYYQNAGNLNAGTISTSRVPALDCYTHLSKPAYTNGTVPFILKPLFDVTRPDRSAFLPADQIIIEKSTDAGATWVDAGFTDSQKRQLFTGQRPTISIPLIGGVKHVDAMIRITITAMKYNVPGGTAETAKYAYWNSSYILSTERYCTFDDGWVWMGTSGDRLWMKVERATGAAPNTWTNVREAFQSGWDGGNYFSLDGNTFGGSTGQTTNYWNWRITFRTCSPTNTFNQADMSTGYPTSQQSVKHIKLTGQYVWTSPNKLMYHDHLYGWDEYGNMEVAGTIQGTQLKSTIAIGTAPLTVVSTTVVTNLNADKVDGYDMNQSVLSSASPAFNGITINGQSSLNGQIYSRPGNAIPIFDFIGKNASGADTNTIKFGSAQGLSIPGATDQYELGFLVTTSADPRLFFIKANAGKMQLETDYINTTQVKIGGTRKDANWDTAYGWGNHAGLYRPVAWMPTYSEVGAAASGHNHDSVYVPLSGGLDNSDTWTGATVPDRIWTTKGQITLIRTRSLTAADVGARSTSWVPSWSDVTSKPTTFAPIIGTGASDAAAGNHAHSGVYEPVISSKGTAFNKNYGTTSTDVKMDGTQAVGTVDAVARIDHVHPTDTSRAATHSHPYRADTWVPAWGDVTGKPTTFAPIIGAGAGDAVAGNDSRLTNARTPVAHNLIDTTGHPVTGLTTGHFLKATGPTAYGFAAHGLTAADVGARSTSWVPSWSDVTSKIGSAYGTTAGTFAEGNHTHSIYMATTGDQTIGGVKTMTDDFYLDKDGTTEVGSHGIVFRANTASADFTRELAMLKTGLLQFNGVDVSMSGHTHSYEPVISAGTTAQYWRGDKSWQTLNATAVGLGSVNNYGLATQAEAEAGTSDVKYMTPLRVKDAIKEINATDVGTTKTATATLALADVNLFFQINNTAAHATFTIPPNSSVAFPIGCEIHFMRMNATYDVIFLAGSGVTIYSEGSKLKINAQYQVATIKKLATDTWAIFGALKA